MIQSSSEITDLCKINRCRINKSDIEPMTSYEKDHLEFMHDCKIFLNDLVSVGIKLVMGLCLWNNKEVWSIVRIISL